MCFFAELEREATIWEMEEKNLYERHQLMKQQMKDQYFLQRHQLLKKHEKVKSLASLHRRYLWPKSREFTDALSVSRVASGAGTDAVLQPEDDREPESPAAAGEEPDAEDPAQRGQDPDGHVQEEPSHQLHGQLLRGQREDQTGSVDSPPH